MAWVGLAGTAVSAGMSLIKSGKQKRQAKELEKNNVRPSEDIPEGVKKAMQIAENASLQGIPDAQKAQIQQQIDRGAVGAMKVATDRKGGVDAAGAVQQGVNDAQLKLGADDAASRVANIHNLQSQSNMLGQWQDKVWDYNNRQKYEENAAAIRALNGASQENSNEGLDSLLSGALITGSNPKAADAIKGLFKKKG